MSNANFDDPDDFLQPITALLNTTTVQLKPIECRKPARKDWFQVSPDPKLQGVAWLYEHDQQQYLILPKVAQQSQMIRDAADSKLLYVAIDRQQQIFLSPVGVTDHLAHQSARAAHQEAMTAWVKMAWDGTAYKITKAAGFTDAPSFPDRSIGRFFEEAFKGRVIDSLSHPVALEILGQTHG